MPVYQLKVWLNHPLCGKSEGYILTATTEVAARIAFANYLAYRRGLAGADINVAGAAISKIGKPPDQIVIQQDFPFPLRPAVLGAPLPGGIPAGSVYPGGDAIDVAAINSVKNSITCSFHATNGSRATRNVPFVRDDFVVGQRFTFPFAHVVVDIGDAFVAGANSPKDLIDNYLLWVLQNTQHAVYNFQPRKIKMVSNAVGATITTKTKNQVAVLDKVVIRGVYGADGINGTRTVQTVIDDYNFTVDNALAPGAYVTGGTISPEPDDFTVEPWVTAHVVRPSSTNVGRPFTPFRGRQRKR